MESPAMTSQDMLGWLLEFVSEEQFLFFAPVSSSWKAAWGQRPTLTRFLTEDTSLSQLRQSYIYGRPLNDRGICRRLAGFGKLDVLERMAALETS